MFFVNTPADDEAKGATEARQARLRGDTPMTEEQIRAAHVSELKPLTERIHIAEYSGEWPQLFAREARRLQAALGDRVRLLEHVGSTSVPGLAAKPKIDILLVVANSADEAAYVPDLEAAGYVLRVREPGWHEHRLFNGPDTDINLHVFSQGCPEIERMLLFQNWLHNHADDRQLYEQTKRELARQDWMYTQNYADAKTAVIEAILARAQAHGDRQNACYRPPARVLQASVHSSSRSKCRQ
jgi:GrpB-like predicted nucleotidyltransferase (UPF0157 family)